MSSLPKVCVAILNWNGKSHLEKFLPSVLKTNYENIEIAIGDNGSNDDSIIFVETNYPQIKLVKLEENYGFAEGYNRLLAQLNADYFVLLNSDVEVTPNWILPIVDAMEKDPKIAAAQPKIKSFLYKNEFEYAGASGGFIDKYGYTFCRGRIFNAIEDDLGQYNQSGEIFWASGAALFVRANLWNEIGRFDGLFFAHMEEIDFCWRAKNKGYKIMYCAESIVYHLGGGSLNYNTPFKTFLNFRNNLRLLYKNLPRNRMKVVIPIRFWLDFITLIKFVIEGKFSHAASISKAHVDFIKYISKHRKKYTNPSPNNLTGYYKRSIVTDFYLRKKKTFSSLKF